MRKGHFFLDDQSIPSRRFELMHSQFRDAIVRGPAQHVPIALQLAGDAAQVVFSVSEWKQCVAHEIGFPLRVSQAIVDKTATTARSRRAVSKRYAKRASLMAPIDCLNAPSRALPSRAGLTVR